MAAAGNRLRILSGWKNVKANTGMTEGELPLPHVPASTTEEQPRRAIVKATYRAALRS